MEAKSSIAGFTCACGVLVKFDVPLPAGAAFVPTCEMCLTAGRVTRPRTIPKPADGSGEMTLDQIEKLLMEREGAAPASPPRPAAPSPMPSAVVEKLRGARACEHEFHPGATHCRRCGRRATPVNTMQDVSEALHEALKDASPTPIARPIETLADFWAGRGQAPAPSTADASPRSTSDGNPAGLFDEETELQAPIADATPAPIFPALPFPVETHTGFTPILTPYGEPVPYAEFPDPERRFGAVSPDVVTIRGIYGRLPVVETVYAYDAAAGYASVKYKATDDDAAAIETVALKELEAYRRVGDQRVKVKLDDALRIVAGEVLE